MIDYTYDVSVVVCTYNSEFQKIMWTIQSALVQENVSYEVIVCDDGSRNNYFYEIKSYFDRIRFDRFVFVSNKENMGTVKNLCSGVIRAKGKWIKPIGAGDMLASKDTLFRWINELEISEKHWSFGRVLKYSIKNDRKQIMGYADMPLDTSPYYRNDDLRCRWNYVVLEDVACAPGIICDHKLMLDYLRVIKGKVVYCEDLIFRHMMIDSEIGYYYPELVTLYEYGSGVSSSIDIKWKRRMEYDVDAFYEIVRKELTDDAEKRDMLLAYQRRKMCSKGLKKTLRLFQKGSVKLAVKRRVMSIIRMHEC